MRGPTPMRSSDLARPQYDANRAGNVTLSKGKSIPSEPIPVNEDWDPVVAQLYASVSSSGISAYYEASDWAMLYLLCDELAAARKVRLEGGKLPSIVFQTVMSQLSSLGLTEGERRRMRIELDSVAEASTDATITAIDGYRESLAAAFDRIETR